MAFIRDKSNALQTSGDPGDAAGRQPPIFATGGMGSPLTVKKAKGSHLWM